MIAIQSWFVIMMFDLKMILLSAIKEILDGQNHDNQLHWLSINNFLMYVQWQRKNVICLRDFEVF